MRIPGRTRSSGRIPWRLTSHQANRLQIERSSETALDLAHKGQRRDASQLGEIGLVQRDDGGDIRDRVTG